jgi:NAD(P)-dependent dehydrogenase (short-subunit alcohol dehydrogenase family)
MDGRTCLVTGGTSGIGLATSIELARRGATVVVSGRSRERGERAAESIRSVTGNPGVEYLCADLSSQAGVSNLATEFLARHDRLHVLINNAGALYALRRENADGIEMTLAVNHLAPFLLTTLLLDVLKASAPSRIINVGSEAHRDVDGLDFDDLQAKGGNLFGRYPRSEATSIFFSLVLPWAHPGFLQYARTKLAGVLFTRELARRLEGTGVTANVANPGLVVSGFADGNGVYGWFMRRYAKSRGVRVEQGARTLVHLAAAPLVEGVSGQYFTNEQRVECSKAAEDAVAAERLWRVSQELTGSGRARPLR